MSPLVTTIINLLWAVSFLIGSAFAIANARHWQLANRAFHEAQKILTQAQQIMIEQHKHIKGKRHQLEWQHSDDYTLCLMGYPIRIKRTSIGKQYRLQQDGRDEVGYDDFQEAMMAALDRAVKLAIEEGDLSE